MCVVNELKKQERKVIIQTTNGNVIVSHYFYENEDNTKTENVLKNLKEANHIKENQIVTWYISRKHEENEIYISDHAMERLKQRNNWNKKTALRMIRKVYENGIDPQNVSGPISKWIKTREAVKEPGDVLKLYGNNLYIFNRQTLITVYAVPKSSSANWMV